MTEPSLPRISVIHTVCTGPLKYQVPPGYSRGKGVIRRETAMGATNNLNSIMDSVILGFISQQNWKFSQRPSILGRNIMKINQKESLGN